jgi:16S rRNA G966 N2-methylase RsmD
VEYLKNNLNVYGSKNVKIFNDDFLNILPIIPNHHVVFIDPPWGGSEYKNLKNIRLKISNKYELEDLCEMILFNNIKKNPLFICLKLPKNYDIEYMYHKLIKCNIYLYELNKMIILIIEKKDIKQLNIINIFVDKFVKNIINIGISQTIQFNQTHLM